MIDYPQSTAGRHLIFLGYKQPFLEWLLRGDPSLLTNRPLNKLRLDNEAFLIADDIADNTEKAERWVDDNWRMFFGFVLRGWVTDERQWPPEMTLRLFREWFDVRYQSVVWDLGKVLLRPERENAAERRIYH